jgi:hypothetical protein
MRMMSLQKLSTAFGCLSGRHLKTSSNVSGDHAFLRSAISAWNDFGMTSTASAH